jgi:hypothetical protein
MTASTWPSSETGPCVQCQGPTRRYGPEGRPVCETCRPEAGQQAVAKGAVRPTRPVRAPQRDPESEMQLELFR